MEIGNLAKSHKAAAEHATNFTPPIYNIWKQQEKAKAGRRYCDKRLRIARYSSSDRPRIRRLFLMIKTGIAL